MYEMLLVLAESVPAEIAFAFDGAGVRWKAYSADAIQNSEVINDESVVAIVQHDLETTLACCRLVKQFPKLNPVLIVVSEADSKHLPTQESGLFTDFVTSPIRTDELIARVRMALAKIATTPEVNIVEHGSLVLNLSTYQAVIAGRYLDMTYMEYELLKYFVTNPGRVLTREELLKDVWGYEYYGGARTVDVHVRRLRAKLGEEHAPLIKTVRSVGYLFGNDRYIDI